MAGVIIVLLVTIPHFLVKGRNPNMSGKNQKLDWSCHVAEELESKKDRIEDNLRVIQLRICHSLL